MRLADFKFSDVSERKLSKSGTSGLSLTIPMPAVRVFQLKPGDKVQVGIKDNEMIVNLIKLEQPAHES